MKNLLKKLLSATLLSFVICLPAHAAKTKPQYFASDPAVLDFVQEMVSKHGFKEAELISQFARIHPNPTVIKFIKPPASPLQRSWQRYRPRFLNELRIENGVRFWQQNRAAITKASAQYGVHEEIIVAIIGVETIYGRNMGNFGVMQALATLAFHYPPRADFFRTELEQFLLLARENGFDALEIKGSFAGAIGIPQFMPGSQRRFAIDFDGDGHIDLTASTEDAIGSVARFLEQHGWKAGEPIAVPAIVEREPERSLIEAGIRPSLKTSDLAQQGIRSSAVPDAIVTLVDLVTPGFETEYWLGFENFYVITRYNRSSFYAMSVFQLSQEIKARMERQ
ncbi:MAG: mltB [Proteobacteria bacterium]|nr:mltB [Pseudomonadota bacterium]